MIGQLHPDDFDELTISEGFEFDTEMVTNEVNFLFYVFESRVRVGIPVGWSDFFLRTSILLYVKHKSSS